MKINALLVHGVGGSGTAVVHRGSSVSMFVSVYYRKCRRDATFWAVGQEDQAL